MNGVPTRTTRRGRASHSPGPRPPPQASRDPPPRLPPLAWPSGSDRVRSHRSAATIAQRKHQRESRLQRASTAPRSGLIGEVRDTPPPSPPTRRPPHRLGCGRISSALLLRYRGPGSGLLCGGRGENLGRVTGPTDPSARTGIMTHPTAYVEKANPNRPVRAHGDHEVRRSPSTRMERPSSPLPCSGERLETWLTSGSASGNRFTTLNAICLSVNVLERNRIRLR